jgi:hypothetical protein
MLVKHVQVTLGNSSQYIPVGQGFFIIGRPSSTNPKIIFKNSQRLFVKEDTIASNVYTRLKVPKKKFGTITIMIK